MEYLVSRGNISASKTIGRQCERCKKLIVEGDQVIIVQAKIKNDRGK
jgi:hypothetical protein